MKTRMKPTTLIVLCILITLLSASLLLLRSHRLDLVHTVVVNAVTQKAPKDYPVQRVDRAFLQARRQAKKHNREKSYLEQLFRISQRLEKIQSLSEEEVRELLEDLLRDEKGTLNP